jgi:beta-1,4-mannooligosaccharide/beta-1,4-mannosyl-N-acetylglucosamine phosphorylase
MSQDTSITSSPWQETQCSATQGLFVRSTSNPLLTVNDIPYQANAVFNAGVADLGNEVVLLLRVETCSGRSHLIVARSKDGVRDWKIADRALLHPADGFPYEICGVEDCRVTWVEELNTWIIAYVAYTDHGPGVALARTRDFRAVERIGLVFPPDNKNAALFPRTFDGLYAVLHRPSVGGGTIWLSYSPDLIYWGQPRMVVPARGGPWWDGVRVGAGPSPIETDAGWLLIYHGVKEVAGGPIYRMGAALLDRDKPHQLIGRAGRWLLGPTEEYERSGDAPNVVFSSGAIVRGGEVWMYYGAADFSLCLAKARIDDVLEIVMSDPAE